MTDRLAGILCFGLLLGALAGQPAQAASHSQALVTAPPRHCIWSPGYWAWRYHHHTWVHGHGRNALVKS